MAAHPRTVLLDRDRSRINAPMDKRCTRISATLAQVVRVGQLAFQCTLMRIDEL